MNFAKMFKVENMSLTDTNKESEYVPFPELDL